MFPEHGRRRFTWKLRSGPRTHDDDDDSSLPRARRTVEREDGGGRPLTCTDRRRGASVVKPVRSTGRARRGRERTTRCTRERARRDPNGFATGAGTRRDVINIRNKSLKRYAGAA